MDLYSALSGAPHRFPYVGADLCYLYLIRQPDISLHTLQDHGYGLTRCAVYSASFRPVLILPTHVGMAEAEVVYPSKDGHPSRH